MRHSVRFFAIPVVHLLVSAISHAQAGDTAPIDILPSAARVGDSHALIETGANTNASGASPNPLSGPLSTASPGAATPTPRLTAADGYPLAGRHGDYFYLRDPDDTYRLYFTGRSMVDAYVPFGSGVSSLPASQGLKPTAFIRRAQIDFGGEFFGRWQWVILGEFGRTSIDNPGGTAGGTACSPDPKSGATNCSPRAAAVQAPVYRAQATDLYINYKVDSLLNLQVGQQRLPFSLENRSSDNYIPFLEPSLAVRNLGAPLVRDIGLVVWGEDSSKIVNYSIGVFNGDGPNRLNTDNKGDLASRVFFHPFVLTGNDTVGALQIGGSFKYGVRSARDAGYDVTSLTTQGGFAFWRPTYTDSNKNFMHIVPSSSQVGYAGELFWPLGEVPIDLTGEFIYANNRTREARDGLQLDSPLTDRYGELKGYSYYAQVSVWALGDRKYGVRRPGYVAPAHLDFKRPNSPPTDSVELLAKFEQIKLSYNASSRGGVDDKATPSGDIRANALSFGFTYWAARRIRASINYGYYWFPDSRNAKSPTPQSADQRAVAPAQLLAAGVDDHARDTSHSLHELSARVQVAF